MTSMIERLKAQKAALDAKSGREDVAKPKQGATRYRLLPTWRKDPDDEFYRAFGQHFIPNGDKKAIYICDEKTNELACPICDALREGVSRAATEEKRKLISSAFASTVYLFNAIDIDADPNKVIVLGLSATLTRTIAENIFNEASEAEANGTEVFNIYTDPQRGVDVRITREGNGLDTRYSIASCISGSKPVPQSVLSQIKDLDAFVARQNPLALTKALEAANAFAGLKSAPRLATAAASAQTAIPAQVPSYDVEDAEFEETLVNPSKNASTISDDELDAALGDL